MGKIVLARVDERLIHGQVMTQLSKKSGANAIFVVDDSTANDAFLKKVFLDSGTRTGLKTKVFSEEAAINYWKETKFENFNVILLARTVEVFVKLIKSGIEISELNLGALSKKPNTTSIIKTVSLTQEQFNQLSDLNHSYNVSIYFQAIPSTKKVTFKEAEKKMSK